MRTGTTLYYLLSDHLGSASLTTDSSGQVVSELRYTPWGEVRYNAGTTPTDYTYTGQYSNTADFGLMFYNARWYDPYLGRMAQADTIIPPGVQGLDRYAYVNNSPMNFVDPSGHVAQTAEQCDGDGWCGDQNSEYTGGDANIGNYTDGNSDNSTSEDWEDSHCPPGQTDCYVYEYGWPTNEEIDYIQWLIRDAESKLAGSTAFNTIIGKGPLEKWILGWQGLEIFRLEEMNNSIFQPVKQSLADPSNHVEMAVFKSNETYGIKSVSYTITKSDGSVESTTYTPDSLFTTVLVNLLEGRRTDIYLPNP